MPLLMWMKMIRMKMRRRRRGREWIMMKRLLTACVVPPCHGTWRPGQTAGDWL